jgi:hypothetical protein
MPKRRPATEGPVRKQFLVVGGVAIGAALLGFVLMNFVLGGGGGKPAPAERTTTTTGGPVGGGKVVAAPALRPGGRNPFTPVVGAAPASTTTQAAAAPSTPAPATSVQTKTSKPVYIEVLNVSEATADVKVADKLTKGAKPGQKLSGDLKVDSIAGSCVFFDKGEERFRVCKGERFLA